MDTLKDLWHSLNANLRERVSNPLYGAFILSWIVFNFRLLLVLAGDGGFREKIEFIDTALYPTTTVTFRVGLFFPSLVALIFVLVAPFIRRWVLVITGRIDAVTTAELLKVAANTPLSPEKADALRDSLSRERKRRLDETRALEEQILQLNDQLDSLVKKQSEGALVSTTYEPKSVDDENISKSLEEYSPRNRQLFPLKETDFVGGVQKYVIKLGQTGLPVNHARALYAVRNGEEFEAYYLKSRRNLDDDYAARVIVDKLLGSGLIERTGRMDETRITSLGRQALAAVLDRGFDPNEAV